MQDITTLVRKQMCGHMFVNNIEYTVAQPTTTGTFWLVSPDNNKVKWLHKHADKLKGSERATLCSKWLNFFIPAFFRTKVTKKERYYLYKKMRFYNDGGQTLHIVYLVNSNEKKFIQKHVLHKLNQKSKFESSPESDPVVRSYNKSTRLWPKALAAIVAASAAGAVGYKIHQSRKEHDVTKKKLMEAGMVNFKKPIYQHDTEVLIQFFPGCPKIYYTMPIVVLARWVESPNLRSQVLIDFAKLIDDRDRGLYCILEEIYTLFQMVMASKELKESISALISVLFVRSESDIVRVMRDGAKQFNGVQSTIADLLSPLTVEKEVISESDEASISKFVLSMREFVTNFESETINKIQLMSIETTLSIFGMSAIGRKYMKVVLQYAIHYGMALLTETMPSSVKLFLRGSFSEKYHSEKERKIIKNVLGASIKIILTFMDVGKEYLFFHLYTTFGMLMNRIGAYNCAIDSHAITSQTNKIPCPGGKTTPGYLQIGDLYRSAGSLVGSYISKHSLADPYKEITMLHLLSWWYTTKEKSYYEDSFSSAHELLTGTIAELKNSSDEKESNIRHVGLLGVELLVSLKSNLTILRMIGERVTNSFSKTEEELKDIRRAVNHIIAFGLAFKTRKIMGSSEFMNMINKDMVYFNGQMARENSKLNLDTVSEDNKANDEMAHENSKLNSDKVSEDNKADDEEDGVVIGSSTTHSVSSSVKTQHNLFYIRGYQYPCVLRVEEVDGLRQVNAFGYYSMTIEECNKMNEDANPYLWYVEHLENTEYTVIKSVKYPNSVLATDETNEGPLQLIPQPIADPNNYFMPWHKGAIMEEFENNKVFTIGNKGNENDSAGFIRSGYVQICAHEGEHVWLSAFISKGTYFVERQFQAHLNIDD